MGPPAPRPRISGIVSTAGSSVPVANAMVTLSLWIFSWAGTQIVVIGNGVSGADGHYSLPVGTPPRGATLDCAILFIEASASAHLSATVPACADGVLRDTVNVELPASGLVR